MVLEGVEAHSGVVAWHRSPSSCEYDGGLQPKWQILFQPQAQVAFALRLFQMRKRAHFGTVFGARANLDGTSQPELGISGLPIPPRREGGDEPGFYERADLRLHGRGQTRVAG